MADKKSSPKKETAQADTYAIVEASGKQFLAFSLVNNRLSLNRNRKTN